MQDIDSGEIYRKYYREYVPGVTQTTDENRLIVKDALGSFGRWSEKFVDAYDRLLMQDTISEAEKPNAVGLLPRPNEGGKYTKDDIIRSVIYKWVDCVCLGAAHVTKTPTYGKRFKNLSKATVRKLIEGKLITKAAVEKINNTVMQCPC